MPRGIARFELPPPTTSAHMLWTRRNAENHSDTLSVVNPQRPCQGFSRFRISSRPTIETAADWLISKSEFASLDLPVSCRFRISNRPDLLNERPPEGTSIWMGGVEPISPTTIGRDRSGVSGGGSGYSTVSSCVDPVLMRTPAFFTPDIAAAYTPIGNRYYNARFARNPWNRHAYPTQKAGSCKHGTQQLF